MWTKFMEVPNAYVAETWKELLETEAISVRVIPPLRGVPAFQKREIWVPDSKTHVAAEVLRKV
jgi:hypothetical protein